ncbi:hypothetical protein HNQ80_002988 [Anaerosolibacter carboniphilus]|uniref:Uncharacterized protein n=1 Tax=Anaerosolibacter carboniphilus TaxID=1417629 RepID=A0A841KU32_9FIRM|nr:hypothetical protein [Anaerosolibacter carboniphilus]MBB6216883.1 hypothetical protein [Anaerosolibacter carboniphilus]
MDGNNFLFSMVSGADGSAVFISTREDWENDGTITEIFDEGEMEVLEPILAKAGLAELMDTCYEMTKPPEETKEILLEQGLQQDKNFDRFVQKEYD